MNLTVTDVARERMTAQLSGREQGPDAIRIFATEGEGCACNGLEFGMGLDRARGEDDVFELGAVKIIADPALALALEGASIDYESGVMRQGYSIDAPNAALLGRAEGVACTCGG